MLISNPLKKLQKLMRSKLSFDLYYCMQKFSAFNFFGGIFCIFANGSELSIEFCVL